MYHQSKRPRLDLKAPKSLPCLAQVAVQVPNHGRLPHQTHCQHIHLCVFFFVCIFFASRRLI